MPKGPTVSRSDLFLRGEVMKEASSRRRNTMQQNITRSILTAAIALTMSPAAFTQTLVVHIVQRQDTKTELTAATPADTKDDKSSSGGKKPAASDKSTAATDKGTQTRSYTVTGATLTLQLPDRRLVRVVCESKYALRFDYINRRSCRTPPADEVTAEFNGDEAKLIWSVSLDNRKMQSETYTILNIVPSPRR
jgi:hypothetical protein